MDFQLLAFFMSLLGILFLLIVERSKVSSEPSGFLRGLASSPRIIGLLYMLFIVTLHLWVAFIAAVIRYLALASDPMVDHFYRNLAIVAVRSDILLAAVSLSANEAAGVGLVRSV
ncbi:MAG: hypothetical protein JSW61_11870 [Candidatus Thorarchaeota archaeon]|nr:MAG: hypothetical protein JSW61_11870 [Candidatus Thorarchaeota archaeon]